MHILIARFEFNQEAISLPKLADWGPSYTQPSGLIQYDLMKYNSAPKSETFVFPMVELQIESLNGRDDVNSSWLTMMSDPDEMPSSRMKYSNGDVQLTQ